MPTHAEVDDPGATGGRPRNEINAFQEGHGIPELSGFQTVPGRVVYQDQIRFRGHTHGTTVSARAGCDTGHMGAVAARQFKDAALEFLAQS